MKRTYIVDNSSLTSMLSNQDALESLTNAGIDFIVPKEAYIEAHSGKSEYIFSRMLRLRDFNHRSMSGRFRFAGSLFEAMKKESKKRGRHVSAPLVGDLTLEKHFEIYSDINRYKSFQSNDLVGYVDFIRDAKARVLLSDKSKEAGPLFSDKAVRYLIDNYKGVRRADELIGSFVPLFNEVISTTQLRKALKRVDRYPYLRGYCNALTLRALGNEIQTFAIDDALLFLKDKKLGNWYDLYFIGWSSCKYDLLSEDKDLLAFHGFLKTKGLVATNAHSLSDLLAEIKLDSLR